MLNAFILPDDVALCGSPARVAMLHGLASQFRTAFAGIEYQIDTHTRVVNAQAFGIGDRRIVRLYGGLALHPLATEDALIFTLLHETGHHRARGRRFAGDPMIACDCLADKWAVGVGRDALRRASGRVIDLADALDSLDAVIDAIDRGDLCSPSAARDRKAQLCWTGHWRDRKSRLLEYNAPAPIGPCYFQFQMSKRRMKWVH